MSSKELLILELESLSPIEIIQLRNYLHIVKGSNKVLADENSVNMDELRRALSSIKGNLSDLISDERKEKI